jgi:hypothetical protein
VKGGGGTQREGKQGKAVFFCPICQFSRPKGKYVQKKGGMFWMSQWNACRFNCAKCLPMTSMYRYLKKVNPELARRYQRERWMMGTTGKGHDCPNPTDITLPDGIDISTSSIVHKV